VEAGGTPVEDRPYGLHCWVPISDRKPPGRLVRTIHRRGHRLKAVPVLLKVNDMVQLISTRGLSQGYGMTTVLEGLDFDVEPGVTGLLGPNGAGKTTLLRTLATVVPPRSGALTVRGADATDPRRLKGIRRHIG